MKTTSPTRGLNRLITDSFGRVARGYDTPLLQHMVYRPPQDQVIAELRAAGSRRIADIGCGTGILTTRILRELEPEQIFGIDASPGMLAQARTRSTRVTWMQSPAERLPFGDEALDAVVTTSAFHFFDQPAALAEFARVLAPGGLVAVSTVNPSGHLASPVRQLTRTTLSPYHAPSPSEVRNMVRVAGFEVSDQRRIHRPLPRWLIPDVITVGRKR
ncbi:ubiquinone/menaquinone biosynthesis C-methylase UbiE [Nocardia transvalensis]|uniref:Ubiquinone/menaquinone biosynthesis C-methylase UbiE n=1 Tax=Nocardia transvalensis TaxID=37333 RepID=A0A7W9P8N6_9NOCA|nr:class I SAM-dependent methyltransferase [Nocardia transvalensis]MBB5911442.1 ubiquinone/menaquinone biosynthesis C-methylase UbiE [Nocardia transvalensis]